MPRAPTVFSLMTLSLVLGPAAPAARAADAALEAAMKRCDAEAGTPLSGIPGVAEVYSRDLRLIFGGPALTVDRNKFLPLYGTCAAAAAAKDGHPRFRYQKVRLELVYGASDAKSRDKIGPALDGIKEFVALGWPDAQYLAAVYSLLAGGPIAPGENAVLGAALLAAADKGHFEALDMAARLLWPPGYGLFAPGRGDAPRAARYLAELGKGAPPPPLAGTPDWKTWIRYDAVFSRAVLIAETPEFDDAEKRAALALFKAWADAGEARGELEYARSLELGRATAKDPAAAMAIYEELRKRTGKGEARGIAATAAVRLASMLMSGADGGKADPQRARAILEEALAANAKINGQTPVLLAILLSEGEYFPREPRKAFALVESELWNVDSALMMARLVIRTGYAVKDAGKMIKTLADGKRREAAMALGRLAVTGKYPFDKAPEAAQTLAPFAANDLDAKLLLARVVQHNLASTSFKPYIAPDSPLTDEDILAAIAEGEAAGKADALVLKALMLRKGWLMPQDDRAASKLLIKAAEAGDEDAMVLAAEAYRDGLGVKKNPKAAIALWRAAAAKGNLEAREALTWHYVFFKEITLTEGVGGTIALYANGEGAKYGSLALPGKLALTGAFTNGRILNSKIVDVTEAALAGFRHAPAALEEEPMIAIAKALPEVVRKDIEIVLRNDGFYKGEPEGYFDPPVREALRAWVKAKGPLLSLAP